MEMSGFGAERWLNKPVFLKDCDPLKPENIILRLISLPELYKKNKRKHN